MWRVDVQYLPTGDTWHGCLIFREVRTVQRRTRPEAVAIPAISPKNTKARLGTVSHDMRTAPPKWSCVLANGCQQPPSVEIVAFMADLLVHAHPPLSDAKLYSIMVPVLMRDTLYCNPSVTNAYVDVEQPTRQRPFARD